MGVFDTDFTDIERIEQILSANETCQKMKRSETTVSPLGKGAHGVVFPLGAEYVVKCCYNSRFARDETAHLRALFPYMDGVEMPQCLSFLVSPSEGRACINKALPDWSSLGDIFTLEKYEQESGRTFKAMILMTHVRNYNTAHLPWGGGVGALLAVFHEKSKGAISSPCFSEKKTLAPTLDDLLLLSSGQRGGMFPFRQSVLTTSFLSLLVKGLSNSFSACKVICHHDLSPRNIVFSENHVAKGAIDFVSAKPSARESEFAAFCLAPTFFTKVLNEYVGATKLPGFDPCLARLCGAAQAYVWAISPEGDYLRGLSCAREILEPALSRQPAYRSLGAELDKMYRKTYG